MRRLSEMGSINMMEQVFCKMENSDFLKGKQIWMESLFRLGVSKFGQLDESSGRQLRYRKPNAYKFFLTPL